MRRFYKEAAAAAVADGFEVRLDDRPVLTPAKARLVVPTLALAQAIAAEWQAQEKKIVPATMPMTQLASTTLDLTGRGRDAVVEQLAAYVGTDLVCYRAGQVEVLTHREGRVWQPLVEWAALRYDAVLEVGYGVMPRPQPEASCRALRAAVAACGDWLLTALQLATTTSGSLVIGLALVEGRVDAAQAFDAAQLHETYQIETWGDDPEATRQRIGIRADLEAARRFADLLAT